MQVSRSIEVRPAFLYLFLVITTALWGGLARAQTRELSAVYRKGSLEVTIPYQGMRAGSGRLTTEIVDPEDHVLGSVIRTVAVDAGAGAWQESLAPSIELGPEDILWERLRYRFVYDGAGSDAAGGVAAVSTVLRRPVVHILGQKEYLAGSRAALRVLVADARTGAPVAGTVKVELVGADQRTALLFRGAVNLRGTAETSFRVPEAWVGKCALHLAVRTSLGAAEATEPIAIRNKSSILLTTEKPLYQPGQTMHLRALVLGSASHHADANQKLTFEVEDSKGNKVFKKALETDKFGIASAEFTLADEVDSGAYHVRARTGDGEESSNSSEIAVNVERYVLPKFKVAVEFDKRDGKEKRDYRPGEHVRGTVYANYFFGKPVDHAEVSVKASAMDVTVFEAAHAMGETDGDGVLHFDLVLPAYFAGRPLDHGMARLLVEASVKDGAGHTETRGEPVTVSAAPLILTAVPEGGALVPQVENEVFLVSAYPDGRPAQTTLTVRRPDGGVERVATDEAGVAVIRIHPAAGQNALRVEADDHRGNRVTSTVPLETRQGTDQILLRTERSVFRVGDRIVLRMLSTSARGTVYLDLVKNGQTIATRDLELQNGKAELDLTATPEMSGMLDLDAYIFGRDAEPVADHRLVFVQPAEELKVEASSDKSEYRPGDEARVRFHVTNARGEGVEAALGLEVVDEAVFALAEKQPGFAKVFFYLEQELLKPRYEIHSLSMTAALVPEPGPAEPVNQAARALFAATEMAMPAKLEVESGRRLPAARFGEFQRRYQAALVHEVEGLAEKLDRMSGERPDDLGKAFATLDHGRPPLDAWGTPLRIEEMGWRRGKSRYFAVRSAGADGQFNSADDLVVYLGEQPGSVFAPGMGGNLGVKVEANRGPWNGRAQMDGTVLDTSGAVVPGAAVTVRAGEGGALRATRSDAEGRFTFAGLSPGSYRVEVRAPGFQVLSAHVTLAERDRAVLSATLQVAGATESVAVMEAPMPMPQAQAFGGAMADQRFAVAKAAMQAEFVANDNLALGRREEVLDAKKQKDGAGAADTHVRQYFPEALYIRPEILTDAHGDATVEIPVADSITTWRMAMFASTQGGALGSGASSLKVFEDFFVDLDLPVMLTQGDRIALPVAIYNNTGGAGSVRLNLKAEDWFALDADTAEKSVRVEAHRVGGSQFTIRAQKIGRFRLTLTAHMDGETGRDDVVVREIEVIPNGREQDIVFNGRLEKTAEHELKFPTDAISEATSIRVRLYPGPLSQVIEGMDSILSLPGGCFEQTSSSTYPDVLALDYMKRTKKLTPEVHAKAEGYVANGYQRLLTFEVPGGGFSWFGRAPANKILTAYGLMEFSDMAHVANVDERVIRRTAEWLKEQQRPDGSWQPDTYFINEGATNRFNSDVERITAYVGWALANTGQEADAVERARRYVEEHSAPVEDAYTLALIANFALDYGKDREFERRALEALVQARTEKGDQVWWSEEETSVYARGESASIETTGLAAQALLKWGQAPETARKALNYISAHKQASGTWGTTQATIMALRTLVLATQASASSVRGSLVVTLDGKPVETVSLTEENDDLLHQFVLKGIDPSGVRTVGIRLEGSGSLAYQVVGRSFVAWDRKKEEDALGIDVGYDRTELMQNDVVTATATIRNRLPEFAKMVMVDLGIPPGFDLLSEDLDAFREKTSDAPSGRLEKFSQTATQAILYFNGLAPGQTVTLRFRLRAKYPIRASTFASRVYEYYDPSKTATAQPVGLVVKGR